MGASFDDGSTLPDDGGVTGIELDEAEVGPRIGAVGEVDGDEATGAVGMLHGVEDGVFGLVVGGTADGEGAVGEGNGIGGAGKEVGVLQCGVGAEDDEVFAIRCCFETSEIGGDGVVF